MKYRKIKKIVKQFAVADYYNKFIRADEFQLPTCTFIINKGTSQEEKYSNVDSVVLFKRGFMQLHSAVDSSVDSRNIDFIDVETFEIITS